MTAAGSAPIWTCDPVERVEDRDPSVIDSESLPDYVCDLRESARSLRAMLHVAIGLLAELQQQNFRLGLRNRELIMLLSDSNRHRPRDRDRTGTGAAEKSIATRREEKGQESHRAAAATGQRQRQEQGQGAPWI